MMNYNNSQVICKTFKFAFFSSDEEALEALRSYLYALYKEKKPLAFFSPLSVLPSFVQDEITNCSGKLIGPPSERFFFMDMNRKHHMKLKIELDIDEVLDHLNIKDKVQYRYMMESVDTDDFINTDLEEKKFFLNKNRTFNFLLDIFLYDNLLKNNLPYSNYIIQIDERNLKLEATKSLQEYLAIQLSLKNDLIEDITVEYFDSENNSFIQISDFFSNLYYSYLMRPNNYIDIIEYLKKENIIKDIFNFPKNKKQ